MLRIRDVYPGSRIQFFFLSQIADLGSRVQQQQKRGREKNTFPSIFSRNKFRKVKNYFILEKTQEQIVKTLLLSSQKYGLRIPKRIQWSKKHCISDPDRNTGTADFDPDHIQLNNSIKIYIATYGVAACW